MGNRDSVLDEKWAQGKQPSWHEGWDRGQQKEAHHNLAKTKTKQKQNEFSLGWDWAQGGLCSDSLKIVNLVTTVHFHPYTL